MVFAAHSAVYLAAESMRFSMRASTDTANSDARASRQRNVSGAIRQQIEIDGPPGAGQFLRRRMAAGPDSLAITVTVNAIVADMGRASDSAMACVGAPASDHNWKRFNLLEDQPACWLRL